MHEFFKSHHFAVGVLPIPGERWAHHLTWYSLASEAALTLDACLDSPAVGLSGTKHGWHLLWLPRSLNTASMEQRAVSSIVTLLCTGNACHRLWPAGWQQGRSLRPALDPAAVTSYQAAYLPSGSL